MVIGAGLSLVACQSPEEYRQEADRVAMEIIRQQQQQVLGHADGLEIRTPAETVRRRLLVDQNLPTSDAASQSSREVKLIEPFPDPGYLNEPAASPPSLAPTPQAQTQKLTLVDALKIGAASSREYQAQKESVFLAALDLDLERHRFDFTFTGMLSSKAGTDLSGEDNVDGVTNSASLGVSRKLANGILVSTALTFDLTKLLTQDRSSARGLAADASVSIPLMRGAGEFVVTAPMTQAQRDVVYAIYAFERYKRTFAVRVATDYLGVLQQLDQMENAAGNYRRLVLASRRARRLADAGRITEIQVDQSLQNELRARDSWVTAKRTYDRRLDQFKLTLGLPVDAKVELDRSELEKLTAGVRKVIGPVQTLEPGAEVPAADDPVELPPVDRQYAGPYELEPQAAIRLALANRLDLRTNLGRILDSQRDVVVAADNLRADLTLLGSASAGARRDVGSAASGHSAIRFEKGTYSGLLSMDLPLERTSERNLYRSSLIDFEQAVRHLQGLEDQIKLDVRDDLRLLIQNRQQLQIQATALHLAKRRVASTNLFFQAGRAQIRDLLEAEDALVTAQNAFTSAIISYRLAELSIQRDMDVLQIDRQGLWQEYDPGSISDSASPEEPSPTTDKVNG